MALRVGRYSDLQMKKESVYGTYVTPDKKLRISSESLNTTIEQVDVENMIGKEGLSEVVKVAEMAGGGIESKIYPDELGEIIYATLGGQDAVNNPHTGIIIVAYNGSEDGARLTLSSNSLTAEIYNGSWVADTNFNTTGTIDVSNSSFDTLGELATAINGYTGWSAKLLGSSSGDSTSIADFSATNLKYDQVKEGALLLKDVVTSTVAKNHKIYPSISSLLPSYTIQVNRNLGTNKSFAFTGSKISSLTLNNTAKDVLAYSVTIDAQKELQDQTDVSLSVDPSILPVSACNATIVIVDDAGAIYTFDEMKDLSLTINNNITTDDFVIGNCYKKEQVQQGFNVEISGNANNTDSQFSLRDKFINNNNLEMYIYWTSSNEADKTNSVNYQMLCKIQNLYLSDFSSPASSVEKLVIAYAGKATISKSNVYSNMIEFDVVDNDIATY